MLLKTSNVYVRVLCAMVLLCSSMVAARAASPIFEIIDTEIANKTENLSAYRDRYGFLWVGTSSGLECYDGNGQTLFGNQSHIIQDIAGMPVFTFFEDGDNVWIGGDKGLYTYNRTKSAIERFSAATRYGVTISSQISKIAAVERGSIWIGTLGQGLFVYYPETSVLKQNSRNGSFYTDIVTGADGLTYAATIDGDIQSFGEDGEMIKSYHIPGFVNSKNALLLCASGRNIWAASGNRLYVLESETGNVRTINTPGLTGVVNTIIARPDGSLFISSDTGIWQYGTISDEFNIVNQHHTTSPGVNTRIVSMVEDFDGNLIIIRGTGALQLLVTRPMAFSFISMDGMGLPGTDATVSAMAFAPRGDVVWVGTDNGVGVFDIAGRRFRPSIVTPLANVAVTTMVMNGEELWIGTRNDGIYKCDTGKGTMSHYTYDPNKPYTVISNQINHIGCTRSGEILVLTDWGVCRYDAKADNFPQLPEFEQNTHAVTMQEDKNGGIWISSSNNGLYYRRPDDSRFSRAFWCKSLNMSPITSFASDNDHRIWAASSKGEIYVYNDTLNDFRQIALPAVNNAITTFMCADRSGRIWLGTDEWLVRTNEGDDHRYFNFSRQASHMPVGTPVINIDNGWMAIGCDYGLMLFNPANLQKYDYKPKVYPVTVSLPFVEGDSDARGAHRTNIPVYMLDNIELPFTKNTFTINFAAVRPINESDVRYDYMLMGVDKGWNIGSAVPEVTYNNLPPGEYEFLLRPHGLKAAETTRMGVSILPPWYRTDWAFTAYILLFLVFIWISFRVGRFMVQRNLHRKMQEVQVQKEREIFEAKSRYFVDLVHEIRTPLMLISLPLEQLAGENDKNRAKDGNRDTTGKYIMSMQRNIDYLLGITNQLLDFRRAESDSEVRLNLARCNLCSMLRSIYRRFEEPMRVRGIQLVIELPENDVWANIDVDKIERLFMNLVGNGMKYSNTKLVITLRDKSADEVELSVSDDGPGVPVEERERIFDTYYQIGNDKIAASLGTGLGLAYAKLIANAHRGNIVVGDNAEGPGALFTITLPKGKEEDVVNAAEFDTFTDSIESIAPVNQDVTVMLVEDNDDLREMITESLGRHYTVLTAANGELALDAMKDTKVDIIVSDLMMDTMDGMELCRRVKSDINYSHIPFIILTAMTTPEAHEEGLKCGADVYLEKPFPIKQLILQIENLLKTRRLLIERLSADNAVPETGSTAPATGLNKMDTEFLERMNALITESINNEEFSIDLLARNLNMSRSSFYRKITAVTGKSPNEYLKNFRLNHAAQLLRDGYRVTEVSERVGFTSSSYFAKCFREKFGVLPSDYTEGRPDNE